MTDRSAVAAFVSGVRTKAGLSQYQLAALLGVRQSAVSQWERGVTEPLGGHLFALLIKLAPTSTTVLADYIDQYTDRRDHDAAHSSPPTPGFPDDHSLDPDPPTRPQAPIQALATPTPAPRRSIQSQPAAPSMATPMTTQHPPTTPPSDTAPDGVAVLRALATLDLDGVAMTIRQLRTRSNLPTLTLASLVGVTADAWRQWETGATHPRVDRLFRLGAVATQHALTATSHHNGVQVLCDLAALGPTGLAAAIGALGQQTGDTPTQLAARIGVDPVSVRGWIAGRSTPQLAHLVGLGKLRRPTSPPT